MKDSIHIGLAACDCARKVGRMNHFTFDKSEAGGGGTLSRSEVRVEDTWDLSPLFKEPKDWEHDFAVLGRLYPVIEQFRGRVGESAKTLADALNCDRKLTQLIEKLWHYASLRGSEDSSDSANLARESQLQNLLTKIGEAAAFLMPEIMAIEDATFAAYVAEPELAEWACRLEKMRRLRKHTLSAGEERLLALGHSATSGHGEAFSQLTNVDMDFGKLADDKGVERDLTQSSYSSFLQKHDAELRHRAFTQFYAEFDAHKFTLAATLSSSVKADVFRARARNYASARESALFQDDVPVAVYENLIASVRTNLPQLHRYYALRKRVMGLKEIRQCDTYVPIVQDFEKVTSFDEAVELCLASLGPLGSEYIAALSDGMKKHRWCDRYENKGKRSGAFSSSTYGSPNYILMNYKDDVFSDVFTLMHEAGHSMHSFYSNRAQKWQDAEYPIFLAEVASTFNEQLLTHHFLSNTSDRQMRAYLISRQLDDIRGTVYRQTMFAEFERDIHAMEEAGEPVTIETIRQTYRRLLDAYFGPGFTIDPQLDLECLRIPHFYNAFYVYKYATGLSAAVALSEQVLKTGDATKYLGFLKSGGSRFPIPTLRDAGVDMSTPKPVDDTLALFGRRVEELEALLA